MMAYEQNYLKLKRILLFFEIETFIFPTKFIIKINWKKNRSKKHEKYFNAFSRHAQRNKQLGLILNRAYFIFFKQLMKITLKTLLFYF